MCIIASILLVLIIYTVWANKALELNTYTVTSSKLPAAFDGFRIAHISDLHNCEIGKNNTRLLKMLREAKPDIIAITGDLIDSRNTNMAVALNFVTNATEIAPCYYVPGNHESRISEYPAFREQLEQLGVTVLENENVTITSGQDSITISGLVDPAFPGIDPGAILQDLHNPAQYTVLLSHRPEIFDLYAEKGVDLVLSGHAHGGQVRLPLIGGLYAPAQGPLPKYEDGIHQNGQTSMVVSRGIGNSLFPIRIGNRPEVVLIELKNQ